MISNAGVRRRGSTGMNGLGSTLALGVLELDIGVALEFSFSVTILGRDARVINSVCLNWTTAVVGSGGEELGRRLFG